MPPAISLPAGMLLLWAGAELLVRGASHLAAALGVSRLVIGLTLVAFGTSLPELMVSLTAGIRGEPGVVLGNVVGSNIANIGLIVGLAALLRPIAVQHRVTRREIPWMLIAALLTVPLAVDGGLGRGAGVILMGTFGLYLTFFFWASPPTGSEPEGEPLSKAWAVPLGLAVLGLGLLITGAPLFLNGAIAVARAVGISELVIGLTLVAVGTSLPELATSVVAALKGQSDIALGNIVGSNVFNVLLILGATVTVFPIEVPSLALWRDIPAMLILSALLLPVCRTGFTVSRLEGVLLLCLYGLYLAWLFLS
ncbi:calcium/sodium antiporter [Candidatus Sumerlaeota bacterium]|nr:calcium/sodium antiporter [Candidatus Sumerlaeota bacterium]